MADVLVVGGGFAGLSAAEAQQLIELLRRVHGNLSGRVPTMAIDDLQELDQPAPEARRAAHLAAVEAGE